MPNNVSVSSKAIFDLAKKVSDTQEAIRKFESWEFQGWSKHYILESTVSVVDIDDIPQEAGDLRLVISGRSTYAAAKDVLVATINSDGAANYAYQRIYGAGTSLSAAESTARSYFTLGYIAGATSTTGFFSIHEFLICDYANAAKNKVTLLTNYEVSSFAAGNRNHYIAGGDWKTLAAVTQLNLFAVSGNLLAGTRISVYGLG